ncbi:rhodanese-like domain-containing protein, partial [Paracoccus yeei]|uniref:rhodanese-like domain-containing protein n=1 Tax=Paracoccus yeei TaxID=147645 RepID=UPI0037D1D75A
MDIRLTSLSDPALAGFDTIIDGRSPSEYAEDHLPGAVSLPVLSDDERARVGTIYKQVSPFDARKLGGALAGLMAVNNVMGEAERLVLNAVEGAGFIGIAVALMGRNHP